MDERANRCRGVVSVVVATRGRPRQLSRCVAALGEAMPPTMSDEVVVVADGVQLAVEAVVAHARAHGVPVRCLVLDPPVGLASARNAGARHSRGDVIAFTDDDCVPQRAWVQAIATALTEHPTAVVGGPVRNAFPDNPYATASQLMLDLLAAYQRSSGDPAGFVLGANLAVARSTFLAAEGFDPRFHHAADDRDFCARLRDRGHPIVHAVDAVVLHEKRLDALQLWTQHHRYGRAAATMAQARSERAQAPLRVSPRFHLRLLRRLVDPRGVDARPFVRVLVAMTQVAYATGMVRERLWGGRR